MSAPLTGVKVLEISSIGPGPFAGMLLADLGADVIRVQRPDERPAVNMAGADTNTLRRPAVAIDLKNPRGQETVRQLASAADVILEGFRPGVMERLNLGPDDLMKDNPSLIYARITGYGQDGPLSQTAGHDINYLAISGALSAIGRRGERPLPPLNLVADYGGGGMLVAFGIVCALLEVQRGGPGQVVDAAMVDGVAQLASVFFSMTGKGGWGERGTNLLDGGAPFYDVYQTADGGYMAVGAIEAKFYAELLGVLEIRPEDAPQWDQAGWPQLRQAFTERFAQRTRSEWTSLFDGSSACVTPVLDLSEAPNHPHHVARQTFQDSDGTPIPVVAPRFTPYRSPGSDDHEEGPATSTSDVEGTLDSSAALLRWGLGLTEVQSDEVRAGVGS